MFNSSVSRHDPSRAQSPSGTPAVPTEDAGFAGARSGEVTSPPSGETQGGTVSRAPSPNRLAHHVHTKTGNIGWSASPRPIGMEQGIETDTSSTIMAHPRSSPIADLPVDILAKIIDENQSEGGGNLKGLLEIGRVNRPFSNASQFITGLDVHFEENFLDYERLIKSAVKSSADQGLRLAGSGPNAGPREMEAADRILERNPILASPAAKNHLRQHAVVTYMTRPELQRSGEGSLLAKAAAHHGLSDPEAQQGAARKALEMRSNQSSEEIDSWLSRADPSLPHPIHGEVARFGLEKSAFIHGVLLMELKRTFERYRTLRLQGAEPERVVDFLSITTEISSINSKLNQFSYEIRDIDSLRADSRRAGIRLGLRPCWRAVP